MRKNIYRLATSREKRTRNFGNIECIQGKGNKGCK